MSIFLPSSVRHFEPKRIVFSTWMDHLAFGYDIIEALKPSKMVELGTFAGLSYFTFCQSVVENELDVQAFAVDTWEGDKHTDKYGEEIFEDVSQHNRAHYPGFSYLMRMTFDEALIHFEDESLDFIHLDGFHTYEAVSHDFKNWYPKLKPGGIFLFHDIVARMKDFGVWKFWDELHADPNYETFGFNHGFGLGVLRKAGAPLSDDPIFDIMFSKDPEDHQKMRAFYVHAARHLELKRKVGRADFGKIRKEKSEAPQN